MDFGAIVGALSLKAPRRVTPKLPAGRHITVPADEPIESTSPTGASDTAPMGLFIVYCDSKGRESQRRITCKTFEADKGNLLAYCHERAAFRRFKVARIREAVIAATGEVIDVDTFMALVRQGESPLGDRALQRLLVLLVFTMKCDGRAHLLEREEIEAAAASYALRFEKDEALVTRATARALGLAPDVDDVIDALRWIESHRDGQRLARLALPFIDRVTIADGLIASQEAYFGGMITDALRAIVAGGPAF